MSNELNLSVKQIEIIEAGLALLSEKGFNDLSLRDIAKKLDVKAAAIYWHFKNKAMLLDYMAEFILRKTMGKLQPRNADESWHDWLFNHICLFRKAMLSYPDGGHVIAGAHLYPAVTLAYLFEYAIESLASAGMDIKKAGTIVITAVNYTFGYVIEEQAGDNRAEHDMQEYLFTLSHIIEFNQMCTSPDEVFESGLKLILQGGDKIQPLQHPN